jgi:hypothetical protein
VSTYTGAQLTPLGQGMARPFLAGVVNANNGAILLVDMAQLLTVVPRLGDTHRGLDH